MARSKTTTKAKTSPPPGDLQAALDDAQLLLYRDRRRAHATLFGGAHRKSNVTPEFHWEMIDDFHSPIPSLCQIAFRGAAKSTLGEEGTTIKALFREFRYCLIVSSVSDIAEMRLHAIRRQFEANESILEIFGNLQSKPWGDDQIELSTGVVFRAVGRGQAIRGGKDEDVRPDFILLDDIEDLKAVANETQLKKTLSWFDGELVGSADAPNLKMRMLANDMGPDCLANKLKDARSGWTVKVYPWMLGGKSIWEDRYPLSACLAKKTEMYARGSGDEYEREYMCNSTRPEAKTFRDEFQKIEARVRVYEPVNAMVMPSPINASALGPSPCAAAVWSWVDDRLFVWECWSRNLQTHEIANEIARIDREYRPVKIGVEKDAYDAWLKYQFSLAAVSPIKVQADEHEAIRALQPFFVGKQIVFADDPRESWPQFLSFPNGSIDAAHALSFALLRDGSAVYEDFATANVSPDLPLEDGAMFLALNVNETHLGAALCQIGGRGLRVFADWLVAKTTDDTALFVIQQANLTASRQCRVIVPPAYFARSTLRKSGIAASMGGTIDDGRRELKRMMRERSRGFPRVMVDAEARWTMNGFLSGYTQDAAAGPYAAIMPAIEAMTALSAIGELSGDSRTNATSRDGREFFSARPMVKQHG